MTESKKYDLLAVGELLADLLSTAYSKDLSDAANFQRFQGGSPANLAANLARLGASTALVSCVGNENLGSYLIDEVAKTGVDVSHIAVDPTEPTSLVLVSRTTGTPDFIPYRMADRMILPEYLPDELLAQTRIFHTTCWPLSMSPASETVLDAAKRASEMGVLLSLDFNYAARVWGDKEHAKEVLKTYCSYGAYIKISDDDALRFFGENSPEKVIDELLKMGAKCVCMTLGAKGSIIATADSDQRFFVPTKTIQVVDATGAGDSYWAGFLTAHLDGKTPEECGRAGVNLAALKLTTAGPLPAKVDRVVLYG
ncbi:MAG: sugar kinase [Spirosomaceae bacterium]|nr:sugar kinase [Spirosomataceae bacterium]